MKYKGKNEPSLFDYQDRIEELKEYRAPLDKLNSVIDWEFFRKTLEIHLDYADQSSGGRPPFDPVLMFKIIVLQKYYSLSEENTEFQIKDRFSFMRFLDLNIADDVPDKNTIWVYKERLGEEGIEELFNQFDRYLHQNGIIGTKGKIVDASFVDVPRQRNSREENKKIKEGKVPTDWKKNLDKLSQKDTDARWMTKNKERYYGYKNHIKINAKTKIIESYGVTDASVHDSQALEGLLNKKRDGRLYADSAYKSKEIDKLLKKKEIQNNVHEKGYRNHPLSDKQKERNTRKSKVRARVEHVFGYFQNNMKADNIRTIGGTRAMFQIGLGNLIYNLFRFDQIGFEME